MPSARKATPATHPPAGAPVPTSPLRRRHPLPWALTSAALLALAPSLAAAAVVGLTVADASSGNYTLTSLSISRASAGTLTYLPNQLIGVTLTDVDAYAEPLLVPRGQPLPDPGTRAHLLQDLRLDTGVINITRTTGSADRSLEITFARPVINSDGDDIILLEVNGDDGIRWWVNNDREGQGQNLSASRYSSALVRGVPFTIFRYDNNGQKNILGLDDLESSTGWTTSADLTGDIHGLGLDLSSVGVPLGASVSSIRIQSLAGNGDRVDPVLIVGLPAVPEPASAAVLVLGSALMLRRRRA